jgi:molybdopterin synthase sulfur carrier subunit
MPNLIHIKAFGMVAEKIGKDALQLENPGTTEALKTLLFEQFPELEAMKFSLAVNKKMIQGDSELEADVEVALLPPFSGG